MPLPGIAHRAMKMPKGRGSARCSEISSMARVVTFPVVRARHLLTLPSPAA
jgi:hypothetical protein